MIWNSHSNDDGDWCAYSGKAVTPGDGGRCPQGCAAGRLEDVPTEAPRTPQYGDRITVHPGAGAKSTHTMEPLRAGVSLDVLHVWHRYETIEIGGLVLTKRGAWVTDMSYRMVALPTPDTYTIWPRSGDEVDLPDSGPRVTIVQTDSNAETGSVTALVRFPDESTATFPLHRLVPPPPS
ncbi:hypothetical protein [Polymorphospora sp. NPDC050346]|uniref:hypothetical protein n=1 Tax=Polymorphospora sp. NPDC050346 TaxID=3155780 RepID=UPI0033C4B8BD